MRINSLYISAFGGIKNLKLDFSDSFNIIYGDNENGKSTVMAFIKMMFYGSERGSAQLARNIRKKYTPWDGSSMAGSIDFEQGGRKYRLEKEFRSSNSTDKATLCDLDFGTRQAVSGDIGSKLFGLSLAAFERSVFIGQLGFPESDIAAEGEINSKLSNIALTGDESVSFEEVYARLEKAKLNLMSKSGRAGVYDKNLKTLAELNTRLEAAGELQNSIGNKKKQIAAAEEQIAELQKSAAELKSLIAKEQDIRNAEKLKELLELKKQLDALNETLKLNDGALIDEMFLRKLKFCISKLEAANQKAESKLAETELLKKSIEAGLNPPSDATKQNAEQLENELKGLNAQKLDTENSITQTEQRLKELNSALPQAEKAKKPFNPVLLILGIAVVVAGCVLLGLKLIPYGIIVAVSGGALTALAFILKPRNLKPMETLQGNIKEHETQLDLLYRRKASVSGDISVLSARLEAINTALNSSAAVIEKQQQLLRECENELVSLQAEAEQESIALLELYSRYKPCSDIETVLSSLEEISQKAASQKELKSRLNFILKDLNGISYEEAQKKLESIDQSQTDSAVDFDTLKNRYEGMLTAIADYKSQIAALTAETKSALGRAENPELIKQQIKELTEKTASQKEFCLAADIAMETLKESFAEVRRSYGSVLEKRAAEIFNKLTDGKYGGMSISKSFDINVEESAAFGSRDIAYLSSGAADQAYLSLRLALSQLIANDSEALPILLDDALTQYDDGRMKTTIEFLKEYSENCQIVMFTCHNSIADTAKSCGAECISLKQ